MKTKGWGPFRYDWFSICSKHYRHDELCELCQCGSWINHWKWLFGHFVFKRNPDLWRWWVNGRKWERPAIFKKK